MAWVERYVRADADGAGDGTTDANSGATGSWTLDQAIAGCAAGQRVNVKNGSYSYAAVKTFAIDGTASNPIWWRGFNTAIGDLDSAIVSTNFPQWFLTGAANYWNLVGTSNWFSNINWKSEITTAARGTVTVGDIDQRIWNCRMEGTAADVDCTAVTVNTAGDNVIVRNCYLKATSSAPCFNAPSSAIVTIADCVTDGGLQGILIGTAGSIAINNIVNNPAGAGIKITASLGLVIGNSVYSAGADGIEFSVASSALIMNNIITDSVGYGINNSAGTSANMRLINNLYFNNTSGTINNIFESYETGNQSDAASPFTNAGGNDFSILSTSLAKANGFPGAFLDATQTGYMDIGAVQRKESGGGALIMRIP